MKLREFLEATKGMTLDTELVVGGVTLDGVELVSGRLGQPDYFGHRTFKAMPDKSRDTVLVFTRMVERSDGKIADYPV